MATIVQTWTFGTGAALDPGWAAVTTLAGPGSGGNPGGCLQEWNSGKNQTATRSAEWTGTWEDLGVPAGSTVTSVDSPAYDWACAAFTTGAASTAGPMTFRDSAATLIGTLITSVAYSALSGFVHRTGSTVAVPSGQQPSNSTVKFRVETVPNTGNSASALNQVNYDNITITVTYTAGGGGAAAIPDVVMAPPYARTW